MKLQIRALGFSLGIIRGLAIFICGILGTLFGYGLDFIESIGNMYIGYDATVLGSFIGLARGLIDGFIFGAVLGWLYNVFLDKNTRKK